MIILGVESSCDETAAAILKDGKHLLANIIDTQIDIHAKYGGVVPELASRHHLQNIYPVVQEALDQAQLTLADIDGLAVTRGPGLIGSLLVGLSFVKAVSFVRKIPYVGVDHLCGHILSVFLGEETPQFPYIALVASGGHSSIFRVNSTEEYILLGRSRDDAAGEAFDKVAKLLKLPYPGGPQISALAEKSDPDQIKFPRSWLEKGSVDFSFSGVKTSVANYVNRCKNKGIELDKPAISASFQEAVVEVLATKTIMAAQQQNVSTIVAAGGVASNNRLRELLQQECSKNNLNLYLTPREFCTDNAAMIALAGFNQFQQNKTFDYEMDVFSRSQFLL